jgi:hypothetical protein
MDNVFIERPWHSLKHEDIYLKGYAHALASRREWSATIIAGITRRSAIKRR